MINIKKKWTDTLIISELKSIVSIIGHFPTHNELKIMNRCDLRGAIDTNGKSNKFRELLGYEQYKIRGDHLNKKPHNYWSEKIIIANLNTIITNIGHFPTTTELCNSDKHNLSTAISRHGGINKFRTLLGYELIQKPNDYWSKDSVIKELEQIIKLVGHFPTQPELCNIGRLDLASQVTRHGGYPKFRKLLGYHTLIHPANYWNDETIINELKVIINKINMFPSITHFKTTNKQKLMGAIARHGGINKFKTLLGYELFQKPDGYWTFDNTLKELKIIIKNMGHFPSYDELHDIDRLDITYGISKNGGFPKFRKLLGYDILHNPLGYWTDETIIEKLKEIITIFGDFPSPKTIQDSKGLLRAINRNGGMNKFRTLLGYDYFHKPNGYWTDDTIIQHLKQIEKDIGHFPSRHELTILDRQDIHGAMSQNGGTNKFRELLGYTVSIQEKYKSELSSYNAKRGSKTEKLVKKIIIDYCLLHKLPLPLYNVKLIRGNVIEFVCNTGKKIGIDVTNTEHDSCVYRKWTRKDYYKYLDELWIIVVSDSFGEKYYKEWNQESPSNVKVMSIQQFLEELDYSLDEYTKSKIDKYCACTFHTKEEFIKEMHSNIKIDTYIMLPSTKYNLCII